MAGTGTIWRRGLCSDGPFGKPVVVEEAANVRFCIFQRDALTRFEVDNEVLCQVSDRIRLLLV